MELLCIVVLVVIFGNLLQRKKITHLKPRIKEI